MVGQCPPEQDSAPANLTQTKVPTTVSKRREVSETLRVVCETARRGGNVRGSSRAYRTVILVQSMTSTDLPDDLPARVDEVLSELSGNTTETHGVAATPRLTPPTGQGGACI